MTSADPIHQPMTVVLPTRNRPHNLPGQMRLLRNAPYPVVVADSSDPETAAGVRAMMPATIQYQSHAPEDSVYDKLESVLRTIETPFVSLMSDRKITLPRAVDALLAYLITHEDHVAAQGYILDFAAHGATIDINQVVWFAPTIGEEDPLQRHYHLMRRYQSWAFSVFRTAPLLRAARQAREVQGAAFQEVLFKNALALQGKMARVPTIHSLQTEERSFHPPKKNNPFYWFLDDAGSFFSHYLRYRRALKEFMLELGASTRFPSDLDQLVDMVHAVWLHRNFDDGTLNHAARLLLGDPIQPIPQPKISWREPTEGDVTRQGVRRYIWRRDVLAAEPKDEIRISAVDTDRVVDQLDVYFGD